MQRTFACQTPTPSPAQRGRAGGGAATSAGQDRSRDISSANSSSAAPCRITRHCISLLDRFGSPPPRTNPNSPANSTPSVANISMATRMARKVFTRPHIARGPTRPKPWNQPHPCHFVDRPRAIVFGAADAAPADPRLPARARARASPPARSRPPTQPRPPPPQITAEQARQALDVLQDPQKRAQIITTLEAIARTKPLAEPAHAPAPATPPAPEPTTVPATTAPATATPAPAAGPPATILVAPDSLGAQILVGASGFLNHVANRGHRHRQRRPQRPPAVELAEGHGDRPLGARHPARHRLAPRRRRPGWPRRRMGDPPFGPPPHPGARRHGPQRRPAAPRRRRRGPRRARRSRTPTPPPHRHARPAPPRTPRVRPPARSNCCPCSASSPSAT